MKISEDKCNELQVKNNSLQDELLSENTANAIFVQRIALLDKQCEDATASASSSSFSMFAQEEFKELSIQTKNENYDFVFDLFKTLDNIFETHIIFDKMSIVLEDLVDKRQQASKAYDEVVHWKRYMKDKPDNVTSLTNF